MAFEVPGIRTAGARIPGIQDRVADSTESIAKVLVGLRRGLWLYFLLIIFEGALRKWILPSLEGPLLIIRDPVAIWLLWKSYRYGYLTFDKYVGPIALIGVITTFTAVLFGHGNIVVAIYGARILLLHFPLIFVYAKVFNRDDVIAIGKAVLWISIPMTLLLGLQFFTPQSSWFNRGIGGDINGGGFSGSDGFFRNSGTFSFTNGLTLFYGLVAAYVFYFLIDQKQVGKLLTIASLFCLLIAIPLSISRTLFFQVVVIAAFLMIGTIALRRWNYLGRLFLGVVFLGGFFFALSENSMFQQASLAFTHRFTTANEVEGGMKGVLLDRYLGGMLGALDPSADLPFLGLGSGMGTNAGSAMLTGKRQFLISEGEWGRVIAELGPLFGLIVIFIRVAITWRCLAWGAKRLLVGDLLPWMLASFTVLVVPQSQWAQPTTLGVSVLMGGLTLASFRNPNGAPLTKPERSRLPLLPSVRRPQAIEAPTPPQS